MHKALALLREYKLKKGSLFTVTFRDELQKEFGVVSPVNGARRLVSTYFNKVWVMHKHGMLADQQLDLCISREQVEFYRDVIEPLEATRNIHYDRESFNWLGQRYGVDQSPLIPVMEGWAKNESGTDANKEANDEPT